MGLSLDFRRLLERYRTDDIFRFTVQFRIHVTNGDTVKMSLELWHLLQAYQQGENRQAVIEREALPEYEDITLREAIPAPPLPQQPTAKVIQYRPARRRKNFQPQKLAA